MSKSAQIAYGTAGACFAVILALIDKPDWWQAHPKIAWMLGFSIPSCVVGAWRLESRTSSHKLFEKEVKFIWHDPEVTLIAAWCGVGVGFLALSAFLLTLSHSLGFGFTVGILFLCAIREFIKYRTDKLQKKIEDKQNP